MMSLPCCFRRQQGTGVYFQTALEALLAGHRPPLPLPALLERLFPILLSHRILRRRAMRLAQAAEPTP
ncbi:MAG: hypothetical protein C4297_08990 [Gemmataceae bacterium]